MGGRSKGKLEGWIVPLVDRAGSAMGRQRDSKKTYLAECRESGGTS
jgi:hypothetical protein